jgi:protoporphyrinogen IX oxidase
MAPWSDCKHWSSKAAAAKDEKPFRESELLWIKSLHIVFMVTWFAGLFYLPRLFVYHAMSEDSISRERFKIMERKLFWGIMTPGAVLTVLFGFWLWLGYGLSGGWLMAKLLLVAILVAYHVYCGVLMLDFKRERNRRSHVFFRWFNEFPVLILVAIVLLVEFQPF